MFERALDDSDMPDEFRKFLGEDLDDWYLTLSDLKDDLYDIDIPNKKFKFKELLFSDKLIAFIYSLVIKFCRTEKIKGIPLSKKIIENLKGIMNKGTQIHYSYKTGEMVGYLHSFWNMMVREN